MTSVVRFAISRLADGTILEDLGAEASDTVEIPHVRGLPVPIDHPPAVVRVREWPNLAGRLEVPTGDDIVRWDRSIAPSPPTGRLITRNEGRGGWPNREAQVWFRTFVRSLEQHRGVMVAAPFEAMRAIVLTPWRIEVAADLPDGASPVPQRLAEFPGGVVVEMPATRWEQRGAYAQTLDAWFADRGEIFGRITTEGRP